MTTITGVLSFACATPGEESNHKAIHPDTIPAQSTFDVRDTAAVVAWSSRFMSIGIGLFLGV